MGNSTSTCTHTCLNPYPWARVWVLVGMGMGTRGLRGFGPRVPRESMRQGGDNPSHRIDSWRGTAGEGRELELRCNVFKFENVPFMGIGTTAHPHPHPSHPLPPPHCRAVVFWGSCSCVLGVFFCLWTCGRVEVVGDVKWWWCLMIRVPGKTCQTCGAGCGFWTGTSWQTWTRTHATHTRLPMQVCKPVTGTIYELIIYFQDSSI